MYWINTVTSRMTARSLQLVRPTRFAELSPFAARAVLSLALVFGWLLVAITLSPWKSGFADAPSRGTGDIPLYRAEAERIRGGEYYYAAVKAELESRGYPTRSVLNWRTPLPVWLIGVLPVLIAASLVFYGVGRTWWAVAMGLAALFVRELAAPYCVVCALFALHERRWPEVKAWVVGAVA
jgi:hypothetical protein